MGTFGYGPRDNDDYFDLYYDTIEVAICKIGKVLSREVSPTSIDRYGQQWRAAASLVVQLALADLYESDDLLTEHLLLAKQKLTELSEQDGWEDAIKKRIILSDLPRVVERIILSNLPRFVGAEADLRDRQSRRIEKRGAGIAGRVAAVEEAIKDRGVGTRAGGKPRLHESPRPSKPKAKRKSSGKLSKILKKVLK